VCPRRSARSSIRAAAAIAGALSGITRWLVSFLLRRTWTSFFTRSTSRRRRCFISTGRIDVLAATTAAQYGHAPTRDLTPRCRTAACAPRASAPGRPDADARAGSGHGPPARAFLETAAAPADDGEVLVIQVDGRGAPMIGPTEHARRRQPHRAAGRGDGGGSARRPMARGGAGPRAGNRRTRRSPSSGCSTRCGVRRTAWRARSTNASTRRSRATGRSSPGCAEADTRATHGVTMPPSSALAGIRRLPSGR
jgi:hypothetical protein